VGRSALRTPLGGVGGTHLFDRLVKGDAKKTRLQVCRRGDDWYCTFNIEYDTDTLGETPIGVDIGERHILAVTAYGEDESMLASGGEAKYVRRKYRSLRDSLSEAGALRARNRVGDKEQRRIKDLNHTLSRQTILVRRKPTLRASLQRIRRPDLLHRNPGDFCVVLHLFEERSERPLVSPRCARSITDVGSPVGAFVRARRCRSGRGVVYLYWDRIGKRQSEKSAGG